MANSQKRLTPEHFPELKFSQRDRELNEYTAINSKLIPLLVHSYLVDGMAFRSMDDVCLKINERYPGVPNKGYKSQSILSYLGLWDAWKGYFKDQSQVTILASLQKLIAYEDDDRYSWRLSELYRYMLEYFRDSADTFEKLTSRSWIQDVLIQGVSPESYNERLRLLSGHNGYKLEINQETRYYSSGVLKEAIKDLYDFRCQVCDNVVYKTGWRTDLPRAEQWAFLSADVHHIHPLSKNGPDIAENMICLCPTCHRKFHSGEFRLVQKQRKMICKDELLDHAHEIRILHTIDLSL